MARGRPQGRSKSDHRVCQAARHARAADYRERISISAEQQEARIAAVNAECIVEVAPRRRRGQKRRDPETKLGAARLSVRGRSSKASGSTKRKANKRLEHALSKAAGREPHTLYCLMCGVTAELGLRGGNEGGSIKYTCKLHATSNGCFRVDKDRTDWVKDREMRRLRAELARLEEELRQLGGAPFTAPTPSAWSESQRTEDQASVPMSKSLIATLLLMGGIESNPGPTADEIAQLRESWQKSDSTIDAPLLDYLAEEALTLARWRGMTDDGRSKLLAELIRDYSGKWYKGWTAILDSSAAAGRRGQDTEAGPSSDVEMQDVAQEDCRRRSNDDPWDDKVDEDVRKVLKDAFISPEGNGRPQLDQRGPSFDNPLARRDASTVYFRDSPSLLLTNLPERGGGGHTRAPDLLAENKRLHASGRGQHQVQTRVTTLIGPSGAGKTRTALEALCHEYGFYLSFSTEKEPGTLLLREAIQRLRERYRDEYAAAQSDAPRLQEFRDNRLHDMEKFISRILLAYALGLLEYLKQHGEQASPKGFLFFQLIGIVGQEDWLVSTWDCVLGLSREAVQQKLADTVAELRRRTGQDFFNVFLDEAQVGTHELEGYFPSRDKTQGRPLLNGWLRSLHQRIFAPFHFNLTGTGLSLRHAQQLETAIGEMGAAQLRNFTDFIRFSLDDALQYAQEYLLSPPNGIKGHILMGRPRFAAQLVQVVLRDGKGWEEALEYLKQFHTERVEPTSLQWGLHEKTKDKLPRDLFRRLQRQLIVLVQGYYLVGRGVATNNADVDMIQVGVCHLDELGPSGECTKVALVEPLAAMAVKSFIATEYERHLDDMKLDLLRSAPSDSATGAVFELLIPGAQQRFVTTSEGSCLADHPLLQDIKGLPACFKKPASMECLYGRGESSYIVDDDHLRAEAWRRGRGLLEFLHDPAGVPSFFPEEGAGPDNASFVRIGGERWISIVQAKCRKKVPNKAHALGTLDISTMYKGDRDRENKREQLKSLLRQQGVKGILQVLLAYPATVDVGSFAKSTLRRSPRFQPQEESDFDFVQVCVSKANAEFYLTVDEQNHLDCIKDV